MKGDNGTVNSNNSTNNNMEVIFLGQQSYNNRPSTGMNRDVASSSKFNSCKTLQRKLELKVERAKKNYSQQNEIDSIDVRNSWNIPLKKKM